MTDSLIHKYKTDSLTPDELQQMRDELSARDDNQLAELLEAEWQKDNAGTGDSMYNSHCATLYQRVASRLFGDDTGQQYGTGQMAQPVQRSRRILRIVQMAAALLLPLAMVAIGMLYYENRQMAAEAIVVSTGHGEQATVTLPDGTKVSVNQNTRLTYVPSQFRGSERRVSMDGEGFYSVARDESRPFYVDADGLAVKVLGTKFNLNARDKERQAELVLVEGSVSFTSLMLKESQVVKPHQKIVLDKTTGRMSIENLGCCDVDLAWQRKELVFRNTPLSIVFAQMRQQFRKQFVVNSQVDQHELFTGTLSSVDLNNNLEIIDLSCGLRSHIIGKTVYVEKNVK